MLYMFVEEALVDNISTCRELRVLKNRKTQIIEY
jgi:hypothetical protein